MNRTDDSLKRATGVIARIIYDNAIWRPAAKEFGRLLVPLLDRHNVPADAHARYMAEACSSHEYPVVQMAARAAVEAGVTLIELQAIARLAARTQPQEETHETH